MAKTATQKVTKTATTKANSRTKKSDAEPKAKRPPSAYNVFMSEHLKDWKEKNPGKPIKEGMTAVAALWRDSPQNPKRGQAPAAPKAKKMKEDKENTKKPRSRKAKPAEEEKVEDDEE